MGYNVKPVSCANWRHNNQCKEGVDYPTESEWMDILDSICPPSYGMVAESDDEDDGWD